MCGCVWGSIPGTFTNNPWRRVRKVWTCPRMTKGRLLTGFLLKMREFELWENKQHKEPLMTPLGSHPPPGCGRHGGHCVMLWQLLAGEYPAVADFAVTHNFRGPVSSSTKWGQDCWVLRFLPTWKILILWLNSRFTLGWFNVVGLTESFLDCWLSLKRTLKYFLEAPVFLKSGKGEDTRCWKRNPKGH